MNQQPLSEAMFYILLALDQPNHGYGIIQEVEQMTNGRVVLGPGTLYGAIKPLLAKGWIKLVSEDKTSRKKKEYVISETGRIAFEEEVARLKEMIGHSRKIMQADRIL